MTSPILLLCAALLQAPASSANRPDTVELVVVATTDIHGHVYHWDYLNDREAPWGLTRAATVVDSLRRSYPGRVVVVDAGDIIQGNPFATYFATQRPITPHPVIDAMNALGYDAAVVGNHEFNFGLDVLRRAEQSAGFPFLGANVFVLPRDTVLFRPFITVTRGGVRVAIGGFTTPGSMVWDRAHLFGHVRIRPVDEVARTTLDAMQASGAALRIVVMHSGMAGASSYDTTGVGPENVAATLATLPVTPHLVVVGHSHQTIADSSWRGVHFVQPANWAREVSVTHVRILRDSAGRTTVLDLHAENVSLASVRPDPAVTRRLLDAHREVRAWVETPVAQTPDTWSAASARVEDTPFLDFINEAQRRATGADLSSAAAFDPTVTFGPGAIFLRDLAGMYPYENTLRAVRIDGATLRAYLEHSATYFGRWGSPEAPVDPGIPGYNYDVVSGVDYAIDVSRPVGQRILQLSYHGRLVTAADTFTIALNSYRQSGSGGFTMLQGLPVVYDQGENVRDVLAAAVQEAGTLRRDDWFTLSWRLLPAEARAAVRAAFPAGPSATDAPGRPAAVVAPVTPGAAPPALPDTTRAEAPIARFRFPLHPSPGADGSSLGNLVADAVRNVTRSDVALVPRTMVRAGLAAGDARRADLDRAVSGSVVTARASGAVLLEVLERAVADSVPTLAIAGIRVRFEPARRAGERVRDAWLLDGRRIERNHEYMVAAPEGLVVAGGLAPTTLSDALAQYLPRLPQPVEPPSTGRWERRS